MYIYVYVCLYIYIHTHILQNIGTMVGQNKKIGTRVNATYKENLSAYYRFASPGLNYLLHDIPQTRWKTNYNTDISLHIFTKHAPSFIFVANHTKRHFQQSFKYWCVWHYM